ncbi:MAG: hypothetical protein WKF65_09675 [Gaiellaceae bacterium]
MFWYYLVVGLLGAIVASGELVSRYRDEPVRALLTGSAAVYVALNAGASLAALAIVRAFDFKLGLDGASSDADVRWTQTLVAGFGAIALFRSSLFIVRVGDQDVGIGPSTFLQNALGAADRGVDRRRANDRASLVGEAMASVSFEKAHQSLPAFALGLMQNVEPDVQAQIGRQVEALRTAAMPDSAKVLLLGLLLMNVVGGQVLRGAVTSLGDEIRLDPRP